MAHNVTCVYCKKKSDRDKIPTVQISERRYAHKTCSDQALAEAKANEEARLSLEKYIIKLLKLDYLEPRIQKQINTYINNNHYTYSGIEKSLRYFYEVKGNSIEKANGGIGIVPYVYKDAYNYYYAQWEAQQKNKDKRMEDYLPKDEIIVIKPPERKIKKRKLFSFLDEEVEDGE